MMLVDVCYIPSILAILILEYFIVEGDVEGGVLKKGPERCQVTSPNTQSTC